MKKGFFQSVYDFICAPLRLVLLPDNVNRSLGLTCLEDERIGHIFPHLRGRVLDVGCGNNRLVTDWGDGVGVDVYDWGGGAMILENTSNLPFEDESFDTVTFIACLNHIPERDETVKEAYRVLRKGGRVIVTMINPILGALGHAVWWYSEDKERGMEEGEENGMWTSSIIGLFDHRNFEMVRHERFVYRMNNLYIFKKKSIGLANEK